MQVFGFDYSNIFFLLSVQAVEPVKYSGSLSASATCTTPGAAQPFFGSTNPTNTDITINDAYTYNPNCVNFGNPYLPNPAQATLTTTFPDWISTLNTHLDLRGFYLKQCSSTTNGGYCQAITWPTNVLSTVSTITNLPIAYTTETIFYAQSAYFVTIVMVQWSNVFACKSRKVFSIRYRSLSPTQPLISICSEESLWRRCCLFSSFTFRE
jgi:hypothetical protein